MHSVNLTRRHFLKTTATASAAAALASQFEGCATTPAAAGRDYYELRAYRLKAGAPSALLEGYLENALIPALNQRGIKNVGVFTEPETKDGPAIWVLIPHPTLESFAGVSATLNADPGVQKAAGDYWQTPTKASPAFDRIDTWLHLAFTGLPRLQLPATTRTKSPRIFELRTYPSFSEQKALKKIQMFNSGEIDAMKEVGLSPVFYGQALAGRDLPHLHYMTSGPDMATHAEHWKAFGSHPTWTKLKNDPQYADTVGTITKRFLVPKAYSQI